MRSNPWRRALAGALVASSVLAVGCAMKEKSEPSALSAPQSLSHAAQAEPRTEVAAVEEDADEGEVAAGQVEAAQPVSTAPAMATPGPAPSVPSSPPTMDVGATTTGVSRSSAYVPPPPGGGEAGKMRAKKPASAARIAERSEGTDQFLMAMPEAKADKKAPEPPAMARRPEPAPAEPGIVDGNRFRALKANPFVDTAKDNLSTFAVDVDTASYTVMRRYINEGALPPPEAVRVEEYVNYFKYAYAPPSSGAFSVQIEGAPSPFTKGHALVRVGLQGKIVSKSQRKPAHITFLVDTSGSMASEDKLPLAREAMKIAVKNLNESDTVAIVSYAGSTREVLPVTPASDLQRILAAIDTLQSGGSTAMGSGMELAYKSAVRRAAGNVVSRVIVLTDGDANIGPNLSADSMFESVQKYVQEGVTLTMVGFGMGNYRDDLMEKLADKGNGNAFYVDGIREARRVFQTRLTGTLEVIAKDVKIQVEFDPKVVRSYRLLGYENRDIADQDFRNDKVDAGEVGAGHSVTALYEVQLAGAGDLGTVRVRAKEPSGTVAKELAFPMLRAYVHESLEAATPDFKFATAVAGTADILRHSAQSETWSLALAEQLARDNAGGDPERLEFVRLVGRARALFASTYPVSGR